MRHWTLGVIFLSVFATFEAGASETLDGIFEEANKAFWAGEYESAAQGYSRLEELGVRSPELSFNRATTEARLGHLGAAVLHYERVLRRDPGHEDTLYNLSAIRDHIARRANEAGRDADLAPATGPWRAILDRFSPMDAALAFLAFHVGLFAVLIFRRFVRTEMLRLTLGVVVGILAALTVATGAVVVGKYEQETELQEAVVLQAGTIDVLEGPKSKVLRFSMEEGSRVMVLEKLDEWSKIRDDQGRDGWVLSTKIGEI